MPSGMLWSAVARDSFIPKYSFVVDDKNVVIPSGILWRINVIVVMRPIFYSLLFFSFLSIFSSIVVDIRIPIITKIEHIRNEGNCL